MPLKRTLAKKVELSAEAFEPPKKIKFADKLVEWRVEMQRMAEMLMDDDQFVLAQQAVNAAVLVKQLHDAMSKEDSYDEEEWSDSDE